MAPCLMVFTGLISTFFVCSDIYTSMMVINNRVHITVFGFLSSNSNAQWQKTITPGVRKLLEKEFRSTKSELLIWAENAVSPL